MLVILGHVIHIPTFRIVNLLCCEGYFSSITFINAKTKYRSPDFLDLSQRYLQNHTRTSLGHPKDVSEGRPQDVGRIRSLELQIRQYGDVSVTSAGDILKASAGDVPWRYI